MHKILFYNKFIKHLYMFRALCAHHQEVKTVLYSIGNHHTETSEWSKITKIQFYKYGHIVVKFINEFFRCDYCILLTINMLCLVEVMFCALSGLITKIILRRKVSKTSKFAHEGPTFYLINNIYQLFHVLVFIMK